MLTLQQGGYIWVYPRPEQVVLAAEDEADIGRYSFNARILSKTFCRRCGVLMTNESRDLSAEAVAALSEGTRQWYNSTKGSSHPVNLLKGRIYFGKPEVRYKLVALVVWADIRTYLIYDNSWSFISRCSYARLDSTVLCHIMASMCTAICQASEQAYGYM